MELNTITWGDGPRTALLLHGVSSNAAGWWRLGPAVAARGYTVVAADLRGHGHSPKSDDHRLTSHAADVRELGGTWDVVLGHSMGGTIAALVAAADVAWAGQLILEDPAVLFPDTSVVIAWLLPDFEMTADDLATRNPHWDRRDAESKAEALEQAGPPVVELAFTQNVPWDYREEVAALRVPTTIIGAAPGRGVIPTEFGRELAGNPAVEFVEVPGSHSMHRDRWDDFWAVVQALL